ncbi:MAG TPA: type I methionyl aminopeptidase [Stenomitos sp.]
MITLKNQREIESLKAAGHVVGKLLAYLRSQVVPGISTKELDVLGEEFILAQGAIPAFKGLYGCPCTILTSVNEEVVHGLPNRRKLKEGDIVSLDMGAIVEGYYGDAAITVPVGKVTDPTVLKLLEVTEASMYRGIEQVRPGNRIGDIGHAVQTLAESAGLSVVREYVGHGIGRQLHEPPQVPNYGTPHTGPVIKAGMALAIEPMINIGLPGTKVLGNKWTVVTKDKSWSAHFEHTVLATEEGPLILTREEGR